MSIPSTHEDLMVSCAKWRLEKILYLLTQNINLSCLDASGFVQFLPQVLGPAKGEKLATQLIAATNTLDDLYTTIFAALHDEYAAINRYVDHEQAVKTERSKPHAALDGSSETEDDTVEITICASSEPKDQKFTFDWAAVKEEKPTLKSLSSIMLRSGAWSSRTPKGRKTAFAKYLAERWRLAFHHEPKRNGRVSLYPETPAVTEYILSLYDDFLNTL
eukprot:m51a1_g11481 hypothetical protein (218) ;mRNA; f:8333-8986